MRSLRPPTAFGRWNLTVDAIGSSAPILEWYERTMAALTSGDASAHHTLKADRWREKWLGWRRGDIPKPLDPRIKKRAGDAR